jgi:hypothetical protein
MLFHDKNVSLDLIWGSMVQTLRDRLRSANDPAKKFQILEVALLSRINERVQLNTAVRYALVEFDRRPQIPMVRELAHEAGLSAVGLPSCSASRSGSRRSSIADYSAFKTR